MRTITARVVKNRLTIVREQITSGNVGYVNLELTLDEDWTGIQIYPCYERDGQAYRSTVAISGTTFAVESALIASRGVLRLALLGVDGDMTITTNYITIPVIQGAVDAATPPLPTPDSITALMGELAGKITEPATDGTSGQALKTDGAGGRYWASGGGGGGTSDHTELTNRDAAEQHPISAITGLQDALDDKVGVIDDGTTLDVDAWADDKTETGLYAVNDIDLGVRYHLIVIADESGYTTQIRNSDEEPTMLYVRARTGNEWGDWEITLTYGILSAHDTSAYAHSSLMQTKEMTANKVTSLSASSTDTQYPSAKCVYDLIGDVSTAIVAINTIIGGTP